jgi:hypothetical protein
MPKYKITMIPMARINGIDAMRRNRALWKKAFLGIGLNIGQARKSRYMLTAISRSSYSLSREAAN